MDYDVIVVGGGNAGFAAAISARQQLGSTGRVVILEKATSHGGGNTFYTAGAFRIAHAGLADLLSFSTSEIEPERVVLPPYTTEDFTEDIRRLGGGKADERLVKKVVEESHSVAEWLAREAGVKFVLSFNRQAYEVPDSKEDEERQARPSRFVFWGGLALRTEDGGKGMVQSYLETCQRLGIEIRYGSRACGLVVEDGAVCGVKLHSADQHGEETVIRARGGVILAAGGFSASKELRMKHLGPQWERALVRGTPHNEGDALEFAVRDAGARIGGDWSGCHATCWDAHAPPLGGDRDLTNQYTKSGYPLGLMLNAKGERFVDEGADFRNMTYAKYGRAILRQPGGYAFQIFDARTTPLLRKEEYADDIARKVIAPTLPALADALTLDGLECPKTFLGTVSDYNKSLVNSRADTFNPAIKDGLSTQATPSLTVPKTNWALPIDKPPFVAVKVTCGITFTFGGLEIDCGTANVVSERDGRAIDGLYCTGEMVGNLWWENYPGGSGLVAGAVFGRIAGREAALRAWHDAAN
ncbi:FAD/NAD(P)-binding domain-containing protein [Exidia glandulosa HHB12029]|uniref:FAD/NAD(P)-binding domain-containing protein n=1 Tax=Exidia glandulosa HHB12029 TaxID=1314781 RepID=A0A165QMT0_EXIGL|nr:FAD/NAD(P)-binding domain-containing protein [Exidia glandulosa HHB12029]